MPETQRLCKPAQNVSDGAACLIWLSPVRIAYLSDIDLDTQCVPYMAAEDYLTESNTF
jgi:hypothetical protein